MSENPAISVIIPVYNAEKYLGACLSSILAQSLQKFEVIVVDDCSTDKSAAIVAYFSKQFGDRLKFMRLKANSGTGGYAARNLGLKLSRGEYIFFMDADDLITKTALEEMHNLAKKFAAEVVHCEKYYSCDDDGKNLRMERIKSGKLVSEPTIQTGNLPERIKEFCAEMNWHSSWLRLVKRDFLIRNELKFPNVRTAGDIIWCMELLCTAKRILRVPNVIYVYRKSPESNLRKKKTLSKAISVYMSPIINGVKFLDEFLARFEFFEHNPKYRYAITNYLMNSQLMALFEYTEKIPAYEVDKVFREEFSAEMGEQSALISYLCSTINFQRLQFVSAQQKINKFTARARNRIAELENEVQKLKNRSDSHGISENVRIGDEKVDNPHDF